MADECFDYCNECWSTDIGECSIEEWEKMRGRSLELRV